MHEVRRNGSRSILVLATAAIVFAVLAVSCGTDEVKVASIPRIFDPGETVTYADLLAIGFKKAKEYDVEGLTGANSAYFGFWGLDPYNRQDYELRFFSPHSDAVELGTALADERIGDSASLDEETATWSVGIKDARRCTGSKGYSGPQNCKTPKYWDYLIYANMILICPGTDLATAQIRCNDLLTVLDPEDDVA